MCDDSSLFYPQEIFPILPMPAPQKNDINGNKPEGQALKAASNRTVDHTGIWIAFAAWLVIVISGVIAFGYWVKCILRIKLRCPHLIIYVTNISLQVHIKQIFWMI